MALKEFLASVESLTRDLGVRIGRSVGERLAQQRAAQSAEAAEAERPAHARPAPKGAPAILPGLPGRRRKPGEPPPPCGHPGCGKPSRTRGYCQTHYVQWLKAGR